MLKPLLNVISDFAMLQKKNNPPIQQGRKHHRTSSLSRGLRAQYRNNRSNKKQKKINHEIKFYDRITFALFPSTPWSGRRRKLVPRQPIQRGRCLQNQSERVIVHTPFGIFICLFSVNAECFRQTFSCTGFEFREKHRPFLLFVLGIYIFCFALL